MWLMMMVKVYVIKKYFLKNTEKFDEIINNLWNKF